MRRLLRNLGADPGEGHRGQMIPLFEPYLGNQKMMYWYENNEFKLSYISVLL